MFSLSTRTGRRGFTLIELLVVVAIIGILAVLALSKVKRAMTKAREGQTLSNLGTLRQAADMCATQNGGAYPGTLTDAAAPPPDSWGDQVAADFVKCMGPVLPPATVGNPPYEDGQTAFSNGIYQSVAGGGNPGTGNFRGWYYNTANVALFHPVVINSGVTSTEGRLYWEY